MFISESTDAFVGDRDGLINYAKNTGTATAPQYTWITGSGNPFNGVDIAPGGSSHGYSIPFAVPDGSKDIIIGQRSGLFLYYKNTAGTAPNTSPVYVKQTQHPFDAINVGSSGAINAIDIDDDGINEYFVGNLDGLVKLFSVNRCQQTDPCSARGECKFTNFQTSTCQCYPNESEGLQCQNCPKGKLEPKYSGGQSLKRVFNPKCSVCPHGKWSSTDGYSLTASCTDCQAGFYFDTTLDVGTSIAACLRCDVGQYQPGAGLTVCLDCNAGTYENEKQSIKCKDCAENTKSDSTKAIACVDCDAGTASSVGSAKCQSCEAGTFSNVKGEDCKPCGAGLYRPSKESDGVTTTDPKTCVDCPAGWSSVGGSTKCQSCEAGTFSNVKGEVCKPCVAGL